MKTITKLFFGCLLMAHSLTVNSQVNINFTSSDDIAAGTGWSFIGTNAANTTIVNSDYLAMTAVNNTATPPVLNNYCTPIYQPTGGIAFGTDRFIAVKSSNSGITVKLTNGAVYYGASVYSTTLPVSPVPGSKFYIHLFRIADFTGSGSVQPSAGDLTCTKMDLSTQGGTPGVSAANPTVYIDWVKSFNTEAAMVQFAADNSKFDIDFKETVAINNNLNLWQTNAPTVNNAPTLSDDNEYMQFSPKVGASLPATTSIRFNTPWYWDMTAAKVVVMRMNSTTSPTMNIWAQTLLPSGSFDAGITAQASPKTVPNSTDKLYVFSLATGSLTNISGVQRFNNLKINVPSQNTGDVAKVDFIKTFASLTAANDYVNAIVTGTGIEANISDKAGFIAFKSSNDIKISGMNAPALVEVFNLNGGKVFAKELNNGSIPSLPAGVYIVKSKNTVIKVVL